jgi:DNA-binding MarR family transcriptional regulator
VLAWLRLVRIFQKIDRRSSDRFRQADLSTAQFDILAHVGAADGPTQQDLANSLLVTKGNVCQLLDRMERGGLLTRCSQGRANRLYLTETGQDLFQHVVPEHEDFLDETFSALTPEEQQQLLFLLRKLDRSLA